MNRLSNNVRATLEEVARALDLGWESIAHTGLTPSEARRIADARALLAALLVPAPPSDDLPAEKKRTKKRPPPEGALTVGTTRGECSGIALTPTWMY